MTMKDKKTTTTTQQNQMFEWQMNRNECGNGALK